MSESTPTTATPITTPITMHAASPRPLIQIPDGNWVDPAEVKSIAALPRFACSTGTIYPDRVVVSAGDKAFIINYEDEESAIAARDRIAFEVNATRG